MNVLHITGQATTYEVVELIANRTSRSNHFAVIKKDDKILCTGGHIIKDTPEHRKIIDILSGEGLYNRLTEFRNAPYIKSYYEE